MRANFEKLGFVLVSGLIIAKLSISVNWGIENTLGVK